MKSVGVSVDLRNLWALSVHEDNPCMLEKRNSQRSKMVLPVKVLIDEATHLAHTVDITDTGAQLGGLQAQLQAGMIILLRRGQHKAKFRIVWLRQLGPNELRAGIECLEPDAKLWELNLSNGRLGCHRYSAVMSPITSTSK